MRKQMPENCCCRHIFYERRERGSVIKRCKGRFVVVRLRDRTGNGRDKGAELGRSCRKRKPSPLLSETVVEPSKRMTTTSYVGVQKLRSTKMKRPLAAFFVDWASAKSTRSMRLNIDVRLDCAFVSLDRMGDFLRWLATHWPVSLMGAKRNVKVCHSMKTKWVVYQLAEVASGYVATTSKWDVADVKGRNQHIHHKGPRLM